MVSGMPLFAPLSYPVLGIYYRIDYLSIERMHMNADQALLLLKQALVTKPGLSLDDCAAVVQAWNTVAEAVKPKAPQTLAPGASAGVVPADKVEKNDDV
jgi:hypothetical protein